MGRILTILTLNSQITVAATGASSYVFNFIGVAASDISVLYTTTTGTITTVPSSAYTVTINAPLTGSIWGVGGSINPVTPANFSSGSLTIIRTLPFTQTAEISNQGNQYPIVTEQALDTLCMEIQQVAARTGSYRGVWVTGIVYNFGDIVQDGVNGAYTNNIYVAANGNTSGVWATDLAAGDWVLSISVATLQPPGSFLPLSGGTISGNLTVGGTLTGSLAGNATTATTATTAINQSGGTVSATTGAFTGILTAPKFPATNLASQGLKTVFTTSGTFTTPSTSSTATIYYYKMVGAGGGGGGANGAYAASGGGGAGAYAEGTFTGVAPSTGITITIGSGGTAGANTGGTGGTGGSTILGTPVSITCSGGSGGSGSVNSSTSLSNGGIGGTVTGSPNILFINGEQGLGGYSLTSTGIWGGNGASSPLGIGGVSNFNLTGVGTSNSASSVGYGSGGQGTISTGAIGGAGMQGICLIIQLTP